ncbi:hypothetical protein ACTFJW_11320 [Clostridium cagae]|uniref:hypothetical protein n=1 Tax=Clostridium cagae TaxID=2080751 RepID=UPI003F75CD64
MITNPLYFSSLNWTKQREILLDIIGDISEENVINYNKKLEPLKALLIDGIDNFNKRTKASISKLKDKVKSIPYRIDECNNSIVDVNFSELELKKVHIQSKINDIDEQIADSSKVNDGKLKLQDELYKAKEELSQKTSEALQKVNEPANSINDKWNALSFDIHNKKRLIDDLTFKRDRNINSASDLESELHNAKEEKKILLNEYHSEEDRQFEFDKSLSECPHCGREYESDKIAEIEEKAQATFLITIRKSLDNILAKGKNKATEIQKIEEKIKNIETENTSLNSQIAELMSELENLQVELDDLKQQKQSIEFAKEVHFEGETEIKAKINELKTQIEEFKESDNSELKVKKRVLQEELEEITKTLGKKDTNGELKKRMSELNEEEKQLQIKIAELEGQQYLGEEFIRTKVELLESSINKKFKGAVTFKLFNQQVNGGLSETCEALINGVPFSNANTASQINAGLSIINTLCEHYKVSAPVFIDNAEAVNEIGSTDSQLIKLKVSLDEELKVKVVK